MVRRPDPSADQTTRFELVINLKLLRRWVSRCPSRASCQCVLLQCISPVLAQSVSAALSELRLLLGVNRRLLLQCGKFGF